MFHQKIKQLKSKLSKLWQKVWNWSKKGLSLLCRCSRWIYRRILTPVGHFCTRVWSYIPYLIRRPFEWTALWGYRNWDIVLTVILTLIGFFWLFGTKTLDFFNIGLVTRGGDFSVTYMGSVLYRIDEWRWPIFTHMNLAYPYGISVHGTDGSPLLSVIFKLLTTLFGLSPEVQFVGIWMLICYILQAYVSVLIFRHAFKSKWLTVIGAMFFVSAPIMMMRVFVHINLMAHFILLFAILLWMNNKLGRKEWFYMALLLSLGILTCPYFLPMQAGFFALLIYQKLIVEKTLSWPKMITGLILLAATFFGWYYLLGMMTTEQQIASGGWRGVCLNLTALFNPTWSRSQVINTLTPKADFDADNYFGLGLLLCLCFLFPHVKDLFKRENLRKHWTLSLLLLGFTLFALSTEIKLGTTVVFDYNPGTQINWLGSVFRYSGRFFWPIWYLLAFFLLKTLAAKFPKGAWLILPLILSIQLWDLYPTYKEKQKFVRTSKPYVYPLKSAEWDRITNQYENAFLFAHNKNYAGIWQWAIKNHKNVNYGFLNRASRKTEALVEKVQEQILSGYLSKEYSNYFFVIDEDLMKRINQAAPKNPDVARLKTFIRRIDNYDILEYTPELDRNVTYQTSTIPTAHRYWRNQLVQVSPYRVYRELDTGRKDYATILRYDDQFLTLSWDHYGVEEFKKEADGWYHQINIPAN